MLARLVGWVGLLVVHVIKVKSVTFWMGSDF